MAYTREELNDMDYLCPACGSTELEYNGGASMACPHCGFVTVESLVSDYDENEDWEDMA